MNRAVALLVPVVLFAGCPRPRETRLPGGARVPAGCERDLSGEYVHGSGAPFRYLGVDDGGTLVLTLEQGRTDGGVPEGGPTITLQRLPTGFHGQTRARVFPAGGTGCLVDFPTSVTACEQDTLALRTARTAAVDATCTATDAGAPSELADHLLVRTPADAGR